jgi:hypothetical protein
MQQRRRLPERNRRLPARRTPMPQSAGWETAGRLCSFRRDKGFEIRLGTSCRPSVHDSGRPLVAVTEADRRGPEDADPTHGSLGLRSGRKFGAHAFIRQVPLNRPLHPPGRPPLSLLTVEDCPRVYAQKSGHSGLGEPQVKPLTPEALAEGQGLRRVPSREGLPDPNLGMAHWQRGHAVAGTRGQQARSLPSDLGRPMTKSDLTDPKHALELAAPSRTTRRRSPRLYCSAYRWSKTSDGKLRSPRASPRGAAASLWLHCEK